MANKMSTSLHTWVPEAPRLSMTNSCLSGPWVVFPVPGHPENIVLLSHGHSPEATFPQVLTTPKYDRSQALGSDDTILPLQQKSYIYTKNVFKVPQGIFSLLKIYLSFSPQILGYMTFQFEMNMNKSTLLSCMGTESEILEGLSLRPTTVSVLWLNNWLFVLCTTQYYPPMQIIFSSYCLYFYLYTSWSIQIWEWFQRF